MSIPPPLARAYELISRRNVDALLITSRENTRYLSGFTGSDSTILITIEEQGLYFFTDSRYTEQARLECPDWKVIEYKRPVEAVAKRIRELKLSKVGFESRNVSYNLYHRYVETIDNAALIPIERQIDLLRVPKSDREVASIKKAIKIAESAFEKMLPSLKPGIREDEWALELEYAMRAAGSGLLPFEVIVASGERGSMPHARASSKVLKKGELVTIDFGASWEGYTCDNTMTVALGKPSRKLEEIYLVVLDAHDMAIEGAKPGMELKRIDAIARKHIEKKGFGKRFGHGLGHGVGLAVHEEPAVSPFSEGVLEEGAVITIEPGIYIPGECGVRIEDMVIARADGVELLTTLSKELVIAG